MNTSEGRRDRRGNIYNNNYIKTQRTFLPWRFDLCQRLLSEEACSVLLPVLGTVEMRRGKKSVVRVAQRITGLVPVHSLSTLFPYICRFFNPSGASVWLSVQNGRCWTVDHMAVLRCVVSQSWFVLLKQGVALTRCNITGPPRAAPGKLRCAVKCYIRRQTTTDISERY